MEEVVLRQISNHKVSWRHAGYDPFGKYNPVVTDIAPVAWSLHLFPLKCLIIKHIVLLWYMHLNLYIPAKPISINSTYYANKSHGMRPEAKDFYEICFQAVRNNQEDFKRLRDYFDPTKHVYAIYIEVLCPRAVFYTSKGEMTSKLPDLSNIEKSIIDALFLKKFFDSAPNLCTDDRYLQFLESKKTPTEKFWGLEIKIEIRDKP